MKIIFFPPLVSQKILLKQAGRLWLTVSSISCHWIERMLQNADLQLEL